MNFQDPATKGMAAIISLHHGIFFYMIIVITLVSWMLFATVKDFGFDMYPSKYTSLVKALDTRYNFTLTKDRIHGQTIEIVWTLTPALVLLFIALPSFALLYSLDELIDVDMTIKVIGHQWYWTYEFTDIFDKVVFDSYLVTESNLQFGTPRLLEVDNALVLPIETYIRVCTSATDVLHAFAVPAFGIKMDCVPGRINQIGLYILREGIFYGQCSEICGVNHGFMPIKIYAVSKEVFLNWIAVKGASNLS